ncbi:MAG: leucine-rich repeat protein, partial [Muribaculaceae bacterium]|nr:leucine-rich repeat protein [Muribaculaceae bacterium]
TSPESYTIDSNGYLVESDGTTPVSKLTISPCVHFDAGGLWYRGKNDGTVCVTFQNPLAPRYSSLGSSLTVPSSVKHKNKTYSVSEVGVNAFSGCSSLQSVSLPSSIKSIGSFGFYQCTNLKSMTLPGKLESISTGAFLSCTGMTTLTIPASVNDIGNMAFRNCGNLAHIYSYIYDPTKVTYTKPAMIFQGVNKSTCVLYVPKGRIWIYWDTEPWSDFNRFSEIPAATGDVNGDGKVNVSDVTVLINMILGIVPMNQSVADVNGDGKVNVSDVTALINMILA